MAFLVSVAALGTTSCDSEGAPPCAEGTWDDDGSDATACIAWTVCPTGSFVSQYGSIARDQTCAACPDGTYSNAGNAGSCVEWTDCDAGSFVARPGDARTDRVCVACAVESFTAAANAEACTAKTTCVAGEFVMDAGSASADRACVACPSGSTSSGGNATQCSEIGVCAPGLFQVDASSSGGGSVCAGCPSGTFSSVSGATSCTAWSSCPPGTLVSADGSATADRVCAPCPSGTYASQPNQSSCLAQGACPAGTAQTTAATASSPPVCRSCSVGEHCPGGSAAATTCGGTGNTATWDHDGLPSTACATRSHCQAGAYVASAGSATADRVCVACGAGSFSNAINSASCEAWTTCSAGSFTSTVASATLDRTCVACASGRYSTTTNASSCDFWQTCVSGTVEVTPGSTTTNRTCRPIFPMQFGSTSTDEATGVATDASGNVYVLGRTYGAMTATPSNGGWDAFLRKIDTNGVVVWTIQFGTGGEDQPTGLCTDPAGNVVVSGYSDSSLSTGAALATFHGFLRKYTSAGAVVWTRTMDSTAADYANAVACGADSSIGTVGTTAGAFSGFVSAGATDVFVRRYDTNGTLVWTRQFGATGLDRGWAATYASATLVVAGGVVGAIPGETAIGSSDAFFRGYDASGNVVYTRQFGTTGIDHAHAIAADPSGAIYVGGYVNAALPGHAHSGSADAFVRKYDPGPIERWTHQFGSSDDDMIRGIAVDYNYVMVTGYANGLPDLTPVGYRDVFVRPFRYDGTPTRSKIVGTTGDDYGASIASSPTGIFYLAGHVGGSLPAQTSAGSNDAFVDTWYGWAN